MAYIGSSVVGVKSTSLSLYARTFHDIRFSTASVRRIKMLRICIDRVFRRSDNSKKMVVGNSLLGSVIFILV